MTTPTGEERQVKFLGGASIDGAPIAYIVVLAAVVAVLSFIPFSVVLSVGGSFPMSQGVFGLVGWVLGPIAGAVASGIGALIGAFIAPHTSSIPALSVLWAAFASFTAGTMVFGKERSKWWIIAAIISVASVAVYFGRALFVNGVSLNAVIFGGLFQWLGVLLFCLPTRSLFAKWIAHKSLGMVALGLFFGTWVSFSGSHCLSSAITYIMYNWPEEVWIMLIGVMPVEYISRMAIGAVIGTGVIAGLRAIGVVKPKYGLY